MGRKRPRKCPCGNPFTRPDKGLKRSNPNQIGKPGKKRSTLKRSQPKREWGDARAKVELEGRCRVCGYGSDLEAAHIMGRKYDRPISEGSQTLYVDPLCIVPLCGNGYDENLELDRGCHSRYDAHELDLLPHLAPEEQARAVLDAGGIEAARRRLAPGAYLEVAHV
jgi:hypothetical protein